MKKVLFLLLVLTGSLFAQSEDIVVWGAMTHKVDSTVMYLTNRDTVYLWMRFPSQFDDPRYPNLVASDAATKPSTFRIPYAGENYWNGNFYIGIYPQCGSGTLDSIQVRWSPIDDLGKVFTNDVRYLVFSDGTASSTVSWFTSAADNGSYGASSNGETVNTSGVRFMIIQKATSCVDTLSFKVFRN